MDDLSYCEPVGEDNESSENEVYFVSPEKILAPIVRSIKKRKRVVADTVDDDMLDFYMMRNLSELLQKLEDSFSDPLKLATVLNETAELLRVVTNSKGVNMYLTDYEQNVITLCPKVLNKSERFYVGYPIETGKTLAAHVAYTKEFVLTDDILSDTRFPDSIPGTGKTVRSALCLPVISNTDKNCIGVIELYRDFQQHEYDTVDLQICTALCGWVGIGVEQNSGKMKLLQDVETYKYLLNLTQLYHEDIITFNKAISDLIVFSKEATTAEKCTFYLFEHDVPFGSTHDIKADIYEEAYDDTLGYRVFKKKRFVRFENNKPGIAGYAARTAETIVIKDAYKDKRCEVRDDPPNYRTRSVLATPVKSSRGVIGVFKMVNKMSYPFFTSKDVSGMELYANYAALICQHEKMNKMNRQQDLELLIAKNLIFYYLKPLSDSLESYRAVPVLSTNVMPYGFFKFDWDHTAYEDEIPKYVIYSFIGSEIFHPVMFGTNNMIYFAESVKHAYRQIPFHNIEHAFIAFHFMFNIVYRNKEKFSLKESVSLLIASLCQKLDHRGVTSSFLELKKDAIAELYDEFILEEHHFYTCLILLQGNDLLSEFNQDDQEDILIEIRQLIIYTNLSFFFHSKKKMVQLLNENLFDWENPEHRHLMKGFLMVCSYYAFNFKKFDVSRRIANNFYKELYLQGDEEKEMGLTPVSIMDRAQSVFIPEFHICQLLTIVEPCCEIVTELFPNCHEILTLCKETIEKWREVITLREEEVWKPDESYPKDRKLRSSARNTVVSTMSSAKSVQSDQRSLRFDD